MVWTWGMQCSIHQNCCFTTSRSRYWWYTIYYYLQTNPNNLVSYNSPWKNCRSGGAQVIALFPSNRRYIQYKYINNSYPNPSKTTFSYLSFPPTNNPPKRLVNTARHTFSSSFNSLMVMSNGMGMAIRRPFSRSAWKFMVAMANVGFFNDLFALFWAHQMSSKKCQIQWKPLGPSMDDFSIQCNFPWFPIGMLNYQRVYDGSIEN